MGDSVMKTKLELGEPVKVNGSLSISMHTLVNDLIHWSVYSSVYISVRRPINNLTNFRL